MMQLVRCLLSRAPHRPTGPRALSLAWISLVVTAAGHLRAADPPAPGGPPTVVAILHAPDEAALTGGAALVQAKCGDLPGVALVERTEIDKVLAEQQLTAVLSAEAAAGRTALGRLLKADLLVVLASQRTKDGRVDPAGPVRLVICETSRGLRLAVQDIKRIEGEAEVAAVVDLVRRAVERLAKPITEIVAVPPFVSNDLDMEYQSLQRPYATVAEQVLLEQPGVLVVELAEARAIADEQALGGGAVARTLPLFMLGEFRHDALAKAATDDASTLTIRLAISRGRQELARREVAGVSRDEAAAAIRSAAAELLGKAAGRAAMAPDPAVDAKQLAARANRMYRLGSWREAFELAETALLLKGDDVAMHMLALRALAEEHRRVLRSVDERAQADVAHLSPREREVALGMTAADRESRRERLAAEHGPMLLRGRSHLEYVLRNKRIVVSEDFFPYADAMAGNAAAVLDIFLRALRDKYAHKVFDHTPIIIDQFLCREFPDLTLAQRRRWALEAVAFLPVQPDNAGQAAILVMLLGHNPSRPADREFAATCIPVLRGYDNPACKAAADSLERRLAAGAENLLSDARAVAVPKPPPTRPAQPKIRFERCGLSARLSGWMPVGRSIDVVWDKDVLSFLVEDRGRLQLRPVAEILGGSLGIVPGTCVCFDGRLVWAFQNPGQALAMQGPERSSDAPRLLALDPITGRARTISTAEGLPPLALSHVSIAPVGEGRVCVIGHVTRDDRTRVWFGMATLDIENERGNVTVFHESRDVAKAAGGTDVDLAFRHSHAYTVANPDVAGKRRVIACVGKTFVIDPDKPKVVAAGFEVRPMPSTDVVVEDGTMHWVWNLPNGQMRLFSLGHADVKPRHSAFAVPCGCLARWQDRWVIVDRDLRFHATDRLEAPFEPLATDLAYPEAAKPWTQGVYLFLSNHYGLVMHDLQKQAIFRVVDATLDAPGASFPPGRPIDPADDIVPPGPSTPGQSDGFRQR